MGLYFNKINYSYKEMSSFSQPDYRFYVSRREDLRADMMKWENDVIGNYRWPGGIDRWEEKEALAIQVAGKVVDGQVIGVGAGSTVYLTLMKIAEKIVKEGLHVRVIPASAEISMVCMQLGIPQTTLNEVRPDWCFDGADEVDREGNLLKGRGGALFREKLLICSSPEVLILVDETKFVDRLGTHYPVPIEIFPLALSWVAEQIKILGATEIVLRPAKGKDGPLFTENGNWILDVRFPVICPEYEQKIKSVPGVVESGLFMGYNVEVIRG